MGDMQGWFREQELEHMRWIEQKTNGFTWYQGHTDYLNIGNLISFGWQKWVNNVGISISNFRENGNESRN